MKTGVYIVVPAALVLLVSVSGVEGVGEDGLESQGSSVEIRAGGNSVSEHLDMTDHQFGFSARDHQGTWPSGGRDPGDRVFTYMVGFNSDRLPTHSESGRPLSRGCHFTRSEFAWPNGTDIDYSGLTSLWERVGSILPLDPPQGTITVGIDATKLVSVKSGSTYPSLMLRVLPVPVASSYQEWLSLRKNNAKAWLWGSDMVEVLSGKEQAEQIGYLRDLIAQELPWLGLLPEILGRPMTIGDFENDKPACLLDLDERLESSVLWPFLRGDYLPPEGEQEEGAT